MRININSFGGIAPKFDRKKLPEGLAQTALNCDVSSGSLTLFEGLDAADCGGTTPPTISPTRVAVSNPPTMVTNPLFDPTIITMKGQFVQTEHDSDLYRRTFTQESVNRTTVGYDITFHSADPINPYGLNFNWLFSDKKCRYQMIIGSTEIPNTISENSRITNGSLPLYSGTYCYANLAALSIPDPYVKLYQYQRFVGQLYPERIGYYETATGILSDYSPVILRLTMNYPVAYNQYIHYRVTCEDAYGNEGPPSDISAQITRIPGDKVTITFGGIKTSGTYTPSKWHIYRSTQGDEDKDFYHLDEVDYGTSTYDDVNPTNSILGRQLPLFRGKLPAIPMWGNAPTTMTEIIQMPSMFYVGFYGKNLYFSDTRTDNHNWPSNFFLTFDYDIVKIINANDIIIVLTKDGCYAVYGNKPYEHWALNLSNKCCVSADAVAKLGADVYYISPDGLMKTTGHSVINVSKPYFTSVEWRDLTPSTMTLTAQGDKLFAFTASASAYNYIFDFEDNGITIIQTDRTNPTFSSTVMTWKSREYTFDKEQTFSVGRVLAESYTSIHFKIYRNNIFVWQKQVTDNTSFMLPRLDPHKNWSIEVIAKSTIHEISIAQSEDEFYVKA